MRSLLAAILSLFLPPRGRHRAACTAPSLTASPPSPVHRAFPACRTRPYPADIIYADGLPLVRPYLAVGEHEQQYDRDRRRLQRERRRADVLAALGQDYIPSEVSA